ncbi:RNA-directed DNA polymerase, eukaryota [Tanacetum coccineum]
MLTNMPMKWVLEGILRLEVFFLVRSISKDETEVKDGTQGKDVTEVEHGTEGKDETENVETDVVKEGDAEDVEVLDNDYFESASDSDDEGSRLRKGRLKQLRKQEHASEQIYKTYFYVGKEFPNKDEVKAYIKEHSIETRREIRMEKNSMKKLKQFAKLEADHQVPTRVFKRIYVCLGPLKAEFKARIRELLGMDGAFMKGPYLRQPLTTVSVDTNNGIYPLAYGLIETENRESWTWFLTQLGDDLDIYRNPNFTFISDRLEEEKARKRGKVFNWETAKYDKIWYDKDVHDLRSVETKFPAIAFNDQVSFDDSDDEDYTVIFDKNPFSYKIISVNDLKTDSENDNKKVNMPLFLPPEPTVSCFDDLDFFKDFENEFPSIVYNNAQTSKSDLLIEPILNPQHIDEFNLKDETSLSECDEEEQNVLNFNDLFPFNVIYPNDSKSDKDNDDDKVDIKHSSGDLSVKPLPDVMNTDVGAYAHGSNKLLEKRPSEGKSTNWWRIYKSGDLEVLES